MLRALVVLLAFGSLTGAAWLAVDQLAIGSVRYRFSIDLELDGKPYSGSTVWELRSFSGPRGLSFFNNVRSDVRGEAIEIRIDALTTLFMLRQPRSTPPTVSFGDQLLQCVPGANGFEKVRALSRFSGSCEVPTHPRIVLADRSGNLVTLDYEPQSFVGERIAITRMIATVTDEPVTTGITERHPWTEELPSGERGGDSETIYRTGFVRK